ncbi:MAG: metallopeptidase TldD-related protein, partial [Gammaproteobacteria bacterium]|nr:metallopeptidase TldD-related protein [Gammaproteobacteria bacterium]
MSTQATIADFDDRLTVAESELLAPVGLAVPDLERAMGQFLTRRLDYADLYCQLTRFESWTVEDSIVRDGVFSLDRGVGVRGITGDKTGFAYADQLDLESLEDAVRAAKSIAQTGGSGRFRVAPAVKPAPLYPAVDPLPTMTDRDKVDLLTRIDSEARALDPRVKQVVASLVALYDVVIVLASDGTLAADVRPLVRVNVSVILEDNGRREQGYAGGGGRGELELIGGETSSRITAEAVRQATVNLEAAPAPAGTMTVVLGPGWPGILLHEAIGHGLEGDFNRKRTSAFSDRIGQKVANEQCTVVDDGTLAGRRGSLTIDDEGTPTECTTLIEDGVLRGYMQDKHNARLMGM